MKNPEWFDLQNYPPRKEARYWAASIFRRNLFSRIWRISPVKDRVGMNVKLHASQRREAMKRSPILMKEGPHSLMAWYGTEGVREINFGELKQLGEWMQSHWYQEYLNEYERNWEYVASQLKDDASSLKSVVEFEARKLSDISDPPLGNPLISIDLEQDDETLMGEFKELVWNLRDRRELTAVKRQVRPINFQNWYTAGVLPCFDLNLWELITGEKKKTNVELGDLLWPNGNINKSERVRLTTNRYLKVVFTDAMYRRVQRIAQSEANNK